MAGYSGTPLAQKLGIRPGFAVALIGAPKGFEKLLAPLPKSVKPVCDPVGKGSFDVQIVFVVDRAGLVKQFSKSAARLAESTGAGLWIAWPKKSSGIVTDVTEDTLREVGLPSGLVDNKVCAIDETWSGLRFVRRK